MVSHCLYTNYEQETAHLHRHSINRTKTVSELAMLARVKFIVVRIKPNWDIDLKATLFDLSTRAIVHNTWDRLEFE